MPQPSSTRQVSSTGLSRRCCLRASPDRPTRLRLAVPKWTRRQGEETPLGPSSGEETPISQDGMSYRVRSLPSSLFHPSNRALPSDCVARVEIRALSHPGAIQGTFCLHGVVFCLTGRSCKLSQPPGFNVIDEQTCSGREGTAFINRASPNKWEGRELGKVKP